MADPYGVIEPSFASYMAARSNAARGGRARGVRRPAGDRYSQRGGVRGRTADYGRPYGYGAPGRMQPQYDEYSEYSQSPVYFPAEAPAAPQQRGGYASYNSYGGNYDGGYQYQQQDQNNNGNKGGGGAAVQRGVGATWSRRSRGAHFRYTPSSGRSPQSAHIQSGCFTVRPQIHLPAVYVRHVNEWKTFRDEMEIVYDVYGTLCTQLSRRPDGRVDFGIKDKSGSITAAYYEIDDPMPQLPFGSMLKVSLVWRSWGLQCVRAAPPEANFGEQHEHKLKTARRALDDRLKAVRAQHTLAHDEPRVQYA